MSNNEGAREKLKSEAGHAALEHVRSGMRLGLGTGTTVCFFFQALSQALREGCLKEVSGVPSSLATESICRKLGIPLADPNGDPLDLYVDGADVICPGHLMIKGGGGALVREKVLAEASARQVIVADYTKRNIHPKVLNLPVEVLAFGSELTTRRVQACLGVEETPGLVVPHSDNGNPVLQFSCLYEPDRMKTLGQLLSNIPGVVGHGLFFLPKETCTVIVAE